MLAQAVVEEGEDSGTPTESQPTPSPSQPSAGDQPPLTESSSEYDTSQDPRVNLKGTGGSGGDHVMLPHDSPLLGGHTSNRAKGSLNLEELSALCTNLSNRVLALETVKDAQAKEILTLKARIKKFEKRGGNGKSGPTKDDIDELDAELDEDIEYIDTEEAMNEGRQSTVDTARPDDDTAKTDVSIARKELSTADSKDTDRPARSILTLKPLPTIDPKDKGKRDEEIPRQLEVELQEEEKYTVVEREKLLAKYFKRRKKQLAEERADAIINKPPTKTKFRRLMMIYLKNMDFVPIRSQEDERRIRDMNKKAKEESSDKGVDTTMKRKVGLRMKRMSKR
nr:hypothetical protein [Tanacetum cinerariifolium]